MAEPIGPERARQPTLPAPMTRRPKPEPHVTRGRFIVLEGGDGSGKSTQAARLATWLRAEGIEVVETFEPGATDRRGVRGLLLHGPEASSR